MSFSEIRSAISSLRSTFPGLMIYVKTYLGISMCHCRYSYFSANPYGVMSPSWLHSLNIPIPKPGKQSYGHSSCKSSSFTSNVCKLIKKLLCGNQNGICNMTTWIKKEDEQPTTSSMMQYKKRCPANITSL